MTERRAILRWEDGSELEVANRPQMSDATFVRYARQRGWDRNGLRTKGSPSSFKITIEERTVTPWVTVEVEVGP